MNSVNIVKGRTSFEAKIEGGKANSFKSPVEAEHSAADRKLTMTARLRRGRLIGSRARVARSSHQKQDFRALRKRPLPLLHHPLAHFCDEHQSSHGLRATISHQT